MIGNKRKKKMNVKKTVAAFLALLAVFTPVSVKVRAEDEAPLVVTLDSGHGVNSEGHGTGADGATQWGGVNEVYYNWTITNHCKDRLEEYGIKVYLTKKSAEEDPSFDNRVFPARKNGTQAYISIHNNSSSKPTARGSQIYTVNPNYNSDMYINSARLANTIMKHLNEDAGTIKNADPYYVNSQTGSTHPDGSIQEYYALLWRAKRYSEGKFRGSKIDAAMIVECVFQSNEADVKDFLLKPEKLQELGYAIADGIIEHYKIKHPSETDAGTEPITEAVTEPAAETVTDTAAEALTDAETNEETKAADENKKINPIIVGLAIGLPLAALTVAVPIIISSKKGKTSGDVPGNNKTEN